MLRQQNPDSLLGLGKKRTQPHDAGAEHDIPARPQGAIKDDSSKLACLCYPGDGPDEFLAARVFNEVYLGRAMREHGGLTGHPFPAGGHFQHPARRKDRGADRESCTPT